MFKRYSESQINEALNDTPVVFVMGARQCGKSTLVKSIITDQWEYITFDDPVKLESAKFDPIGFIKNLSSKNIVLDEIQRAPELFVIIKQSVDENRAPGRFILTGSANALLLPQLSDSLAGRMESILLKPLSECEVLGNPPSFLKKIFENKTPVLKQSDSREYLLNRVVTGCFPEPLQRSNPKRRMLWYKSYINALILRDARDLGQITHIKELEKLMHMICFYSAKLVNFSDLGAKIKLNHVTVQKYLSLLEQLFLVETLPAWHSNEYKRLVKAPKIHVSDTGLISAIRGVTTDKLFQNAKELGSLLESFVFNELKKQASWLDEPINFYHYRDKDKVEIDLILENQVGNHVAIEIKASATVMGSDFNGIKKFQTIIGEKFARGIVLYDGEEVVPFGEKLLAIPISALWRTI